MLNNFMPQSGSLERKALFFTQSPTLVKFHEHGCLQGLHICHTLLKLEGPKPPVCQNSPMKLQICVCLKTECGKFPKETFYKNCFSHPCFSLKSVTTKALTIDHKVSHNQVSVSGRHHFSTEHWMKSKAQIMRSI